MNAQSLINNYMEYGLLEKGKQNKIKAILMIKILLSSFNFHA